MSNVGLLDDGLDLMNSGEAVDYTIDTRPLWERVVPEEGLYLGLDVSAESTGISIIENSSRFSANIIVDSDNCKGVHKEVLMRRALKSDLRELIKGKDFDAILIEDVYIGENAQTVRLLYALNTAIDEMILDEECSCKEFLRVSNKTWKSWLSKVDTEGLAKGYNDKEQIQIYMDILGITEEGEGFQDRLDAGGMLFGYFLTGKSLFESGKLLKKKKVSIKDVELRFDIDTAYLFYGSDIDISECNVEYVDLRRISRTRVLSMLSEDPSKVYITSKPVLPGNLRQYFDMDYTSEGGYVAFWVKRSKLKKYIGG